MKPRSKKTEFALTVCAAVKDNRPDLYNAVAKRPVSIEEAQERGWPHFFDGVSKCTQGHVAARYVSNPARCIDCARIADGNPPIYTQGDANADLAGLPAYVDPVASDGFDWTDDRKRQFLTAWKNTTSIPAALKVMGAQPTHLIDLKRTDPEFQADFEAAQRDVEMVQLWNMEGSAASGSDRVALAMASSKFTQFGAKTGLAGRPPVNSEQARAELTQLLSALDRSIAQQERLESITSAAGTRKVGATNVLTADAADTPVEGPALLASSHDNSDLVSNTGSESGIPEADAALPPRRKI